MGAPQTKIESLRPLRQTVKKEVMGEIGQLEDEALKRKQRLASLKRKLETERGITESDSTDQEEAPKPIFRSYKPITEDLEDNVLSQADPANVEESISDTLAKSSEVVMDELDFVNLAPRKPDWDLKRDIAKKLEKLERRTARAIGEVIRERLRAEEGGEEDLASAVAAGASYSAQPEEED